MKKLLILLSVFLTGIFLSGCNSCTPLPPVPDDGMIYKYVYEIEQIGTKSLEMPMLNLSLEVVDKLAPNVYVVECLFKSEVPVGINAISIVVDYNPEEVSISKDVIINDHFYVEENNNNDFPMSMFNNTGTQFRFGFFTLSENIVESAFIFRIIVTINNPTKLEYSSQPGYLEIVDIDSKKYPIEYQNIIFIEK
jgi:hypothetical protein